MRRRLSARGWGPWRREWYSICSAHSVDADRCPRCAVGVWKNAWAVALGHCVYKAFPRLWRWWANRRNRWVDQRRQRW